ncbi:hypothetical protein [Flavobacterium silvaticum]|uniref:Uncharacterized protein n=1 Tax=Flavobacterium silvaticum TaxID=1852020 RepID=A0A972JGD2_9FLAO|nr:hypothetical protein [Flavobacterium silvaticum]NMH26730.1 hypothetical protein [Flavobacterium silvaticum]
MILSSVFVFLVMSCILVWHQIKIRRQTLMHEQSMLALHQKFVEENYNNLIAKGQVKLSDEMLNSIRQSNTIIGSDIYLAFRDTMGQLYGKE